MEVINASVLIACHEKEEYIQECIDSVLRQTKQPKEIIVVHDGCNEPKSHTKTVTIILPENTGVVKARHEAFRYSTGELVLFLDADDMLSPDCLEKMTLAIADGADIAYPEIYFWAGPESGLAKTPETIIPAQIRKNGKIAIPVSCLMKREVYEKVGGFRRFEVMEDLDFWMRALCNDYTFKKTTTLLWYRQIQGNRNSMDISRKREITKEILNQFNITDKKVSLK